MRDAAARGQAHNDGNVGDVGGGGGSVAVVAMVIVIVISAAGRLRWALQWVMNIGDRLSGLEAVCPVTWSVVRPSTSGLPKLQQ